LTVPIYPNSALAQTEPILNMKNTIWSRAVLLSALILTTQALAGPSISVNFQGRDGSGDVTGNPGTPPITGFMAGVVPDLTWNDIDDSTFTPPETGTTPQLLDSTVNLSPVTLTFDCNDSWYNDVTPTNLTTPNAQLMNGIIKVGTGKKVGAFVFNNVPEGQYDLYVYCDMNGDNTGLKVSDLAMTTSYYVVEQHQFRDTNTFIQGTNTDPNNTNDVCNYVKLSNLGTAGTGRIGAIVEWLRNADGIGIAGLQLVNTGPATVNTTPVAVTANPFNRRVLAGDSNVVVSISVKGPVDGVQWFKNGAPVGTNDLSYKGVTTNGLIISYTLPAVVAGDNGAQFYAMISNNVNSAQSAPAVITVGHAVATTGVQEKLWLGATRVTVEDGSHDSVTPDIQLVLGTFEAPTGQGNNYAERVNAVFIPPATTNYVWFITSDDDSDLFISSDSTPANKTLVAQEVSWSNPRTWVSNDGGTGNHDVSQKRSDMWEVTPTDPSAVPLGSNGIHMVQGQQYYIEAVHHQGTGGDGAGVTFKMFGEPDPKNGDPSRVNAFNTAPGPLALDGGVITVTNPPADISATQTLTATFSIGATSSYIGDNSGVGPSIAYQWQMAPSGSSTFTSIPGANGTSYTTPLLKLSDSGSQFRVAMIAGDASTNSTVATLTVLPDTIPPRPATVTGVVATGLQLSLSFSELLDKASAETVGNYVINPGTGSIVVTNASLDSGLTTVTLLLGGKLPTTVTNILAITGVKDVAGNPVPQNTTISFSYTLVTYQADILFDSPIAYFRFEDATSSAVAHNSGTSGIEGAYYVGDEASAGAGGVSTNASGDPGPRPPQFAGFDPSNNSARFSGSTANGGAQEWVDAKSQYLQALPAFSLEYWCAPIRTNAAYVNGVDWGTRIGLVGQNDAIEYGFIDPGTIQIWTPNGGSLNTTYTFPDGDWHHIATIADGSTLKNYYDGVLVGTGGNAIGATGGYGSSTYNVHIGGGGVFDATGNYFVGHIDEVAIFNKAIPAGRILEHYNAGKSGGVITVSGAVTPGAGLKVSISASGGSATLSWSPAGGNLQSTTNLGSAAVWSVIGTTNPITLPIGPGAKFFRVQQ
jgi:hypothetical protein